MSNALKKLKAETGEELLNFLATLSKEELKLPLRIILSEEALQEDDPETKDGCIFLLVE